MSELDEIFESPKVINEIKVEGIPEYTSKEWDAYVMSHFEPDELIEGSPKTSALRRVAELLLGDIVESGPADVFPSHVVDGPGRATVVFRVTFDGWMGRGQVRVFTEVADCWIGNTDEPYCNHTVATASTKAEGRALRKALKIKALAAEELVTTQRTVKKEQPTTGEVDPDAMISSAQESFIKAKCKQLGLDTDKLLKLHGYEDINKVPKGTAALILKSLSEMQNKEQDIPSEIKS